MKNIETRRKLNNLKKALLIAGFTAGITACSKQEYNVPEGYELVVNTDENGKCYYMGIKKIKVTETIEATENEKQKIR